MALSIGQLAAITQSHIIPKAVEQIFSSNPLFYRMREKGIKYDGSLSIKQPLVHTATGSVTAFSGYDILPTAPTDQITAAEFSWRQYAATVTISGEEELKNSGKDGIMNLLELKKDIAALSLEDTLGTDLQGSNTGGKSIDGLASILSTTTTYGGIAVADMATWVAKVPTLATAGTLTKYEFQKAMGQATVGNDKPTIAITRQSVYDKIWSLWEGQQRFENTQKGDAGFTTMTVNGLDVVVDSHVTGSDGASQTNWLEFLNERYLHMFIHKDYNFKAVPIPPQRDQDIKMVRWLVALNLACSRRIMQCVIKTIDPAL